MAFVFLRAFGLVCLVTIGTCIVAESEAQNDRCSDLDSPHACFDLGQLNQSILISGSFESCVASDPRTRPTSPGNQDYAVIYQFSVTSGGLVELEMDGLGNSILIKHGNITFWGGENVTSIRRHFDAGPYTFVATAPTCTNGDVELQPVYRIQIDPGSEETIVREDLQRPVRVVEPAQVEEEPLESRMTKWLMGGAIAGGTFMFILFLIALAMAPIA